MTYFRATDPFPLESAEQNKLHEFYERLGQGRLATTMCARCECAADEFTWVELPRDGTVHAFTIQDTGLPHGFEAPRVFAVVKVGEARIFAPIVGPRATTVKVGSPVRLSPVRVADDARGSPRYLLAFEPVEAPA